MTGTVAEISIAFILTMGGVVIGWWLFRDTAVPTVDINVSTTVNGRTVSMKYRGPRSGLADAWRIHNEEQARLRTIPRETGEAP